MRKTPSSRLNRTIFWFLIVLSIVAVISLMLAFYGFNREVEIMDGIKITNSKNERPIVQDSFEEMFDDGSNQISGSVSQVLERKDVQGKWITIIPNAPGEIVDEQQMSDSKGMVEKQESAYRFYIAPDTDGISSVQGGESVTLSFFGDPSETDYMPVYKIHAVE